MNVGSKELNKLPITLILMGTHTSGKRIIGLEVARMLNWHFDPELGDVLRENKQLKNGHQLGYEENWDEKIFLAEEDRDEKSLGKCRVVETWHIGNLLWAMFRDPFNARDRYLQRTIKDVQTEMGKSRIIIIFLNISKETVLRRHKINQEKKEEINMSDEEMMCYALHEKLGMDKLNEILFAMSPELILPYTVISNDIDEDENNDIITKVTNVIIDSVKGL